MENNQLDNEITHEMMTNDGHYSSDGLSIKSQKTINKLKKSSNESWLIIDSKKPLKSESESMRITRGDIGNKRSSMLTIYHTNDTYVGSNSANLPRDLIRLPNTVQSSSVPLSKIYQEWPDFLKKS